ncbi:MAG: hypothetical protein HOQ22_16065 [Nocardioidaceae bacterium]|nr:hypothetical protein [Nocardioidaceae bacterium]NUS52541.1 hypothetical protein [Nocardioidaceae bacterium]
MSEQHFEPDQPEPRPDPVEEQPAESTGHPAVDEVVASLDGLGDRPVEEHVAVFESAHDRLRGALADAGDEPSS